MSRIEAAFHQRQTSQLAAGAAAVATVLGLSIAIGQVAPSGGTDVAPPTPISTAAPTPVDPGAPSSGATPSAVNTSAAAPATQATSGYNDGTFTGAASYRVEGHQEQISVTVSLQGGTIASASVVNSESNGTSAFYQERFAQSFQAKVIGKPIADLKLPVIAGASKTTGGFNQAIAQIRQAAAVR